VGSARLSQKDVTALVESQQRLATLIKGVYFLVNTTNYLWLDSTVVKQKYFFWLRIHGAQLLNAAPRLRIVLLDTTKKNFLPELDKKSSLKLD
jgi:hypothetical protein